MKSEVEFSSDRSLRRHSPVDPAVNAPQAETPPPVIEHLRALLICHKAFQCMIQAPLSVRDEQSVNENIASHGASKTSNSPAHVRKSLQNVFLWCSDSLKVWHKMRKITIFAFLNLNHCYEHLLAQKKNQSLTYTPFSFFVVFSISETEPGEKERAR